MSSLQREKLFQNVSPLDVENEDFGILHEMIPNAQEWMCTRVVIEQLEANSCDRFWPASENGLSQKSERV
jgi:hypothetical protein